MHEQIEYIKNEWKLWKMNILLNESNSSKKTLNSTL